jgi:hypothetical protein
VESCGCGWENVNRQRINGRSGDYLSENIIHSDHRLSLGEMTPRNTNFFSAPSLLAALSRRDSRFCTLSIEYNDWSRPFPASSLSCYHFCGRDEESLSHFHVRISPICESAPKCVSDRIRSKPCYFDHFKQFWFHVVLKSLDRTVCQLSWITFINHT